MVARRKPTSVSREGNVTFRIRLKPQDQDLHTFFSYIYCKWKSSYIYHELGIALVNYLKKKAPVSKINVVNKVIIMKLEKWLRETKYTYQYQ